MHTLRYDTAGQRKGAATRYLLRDHLGGVHALVDLDGPIQAMAFGPWGRRRGAGDWADLSKPAQASNSHTNITTRGFTGHEMLDTASLIHMNGRLYDPELGRFLQADPFIQFLAQTQGHNRYSYVLNNPTSLTDPTGHFVFSLSAMLFVAAQETVKWYVAAAVLGAGGFADALSQGATFERALLSGIISGVSGAAFSGIGSHLATHFGGGFAAGLSGAGFALKVGLHGTVGGIAGALQGGRFGHGFAAAGLTALGSGFNNSRFVGGPGFSPARVTVAAAIGGTASRITGGKFANGAVTGAFSQALNNEASEVEMQGDRHYTVVKGVILDPGTEALVNEMANAYHAETGASIQVNSGTRTAETQARAMFDKIKGGDDILQLYKRQDLAKQIQNAYEDGTNAGRPSETVVRAMARVIRAQISQGEYISKHLVSRAVDIQARGMSPEQEAAFKQAALKVDATVLWELGHWHLQF